MKWTIGGLYSITEIYMLADSSPDLCDSCAFDDRLKGAFEENIQESTYLPEPAGARIGEESFSTKFYCKHHSSSWSV